MRNFFFVFLCSLILVSTAYAKTNQTNKNQKDIEALKIEIENLKQRLSEVQEHTTAVLPPEITAESNESKIEYRETFGDRQVAVPRLNDLSIQKDYRGFIAIPHTHSMIRFNARPRVDFTNDSAYSGDDNMFVTSKIPVTGQVNKINGYFFNTNTRGTKISMDIRSPMLEGKPRFYYENDFAAAGTRYLNYRVRHLYGSMYNFTIGQTYTVFEDADSWPDTVDYEGPNAAISSRRPLLKYMMSVADNWTLTLAIEKPDAQVDTSIDQTASSENRAPEFGFNIRWEQKKTGHIQVGSIFRRIGVSGSIVGKQTVSGWGLNFSSSLKTFGRDSFQTQITYGYGIFYFMNDATSNNDAAFDANGKLTLTCPYNCYHFLS